MKRKLLSLFLVLCMILPLNVTTLVYADSYESGGTYVSSIDYTCVDSSDNDLTVSAECYYTETRSGYPSTGQIVLNQSYDLNVPSNSNDVTVTLNLSEAGTGMTFELYDDPRYYDPDVGESTYLESDEYDFDSDTNIVTLSDWNGHYTSFGFYVSNDGSYDTLKEWVYITIYSEKTIEADDTCTVRVMNPLEGLSTDVPAFGETEDIQFYGYAIGDVGDNQDITLDFDNITYSFARGDDKAMTGITLDSNTGMMTLDSSAVPGLVKVTATYEITGTTGYEYLVISDTGKYGYTSYVSYSNENNSDDRGYMQDCLVTLTKADGTVHTATSLSDGFVWINNITDYDGDVTITGTKTGYLLYYTNNYTAYKCSTGSYVSMYIPEVLFSGGSGTSEDPYQISTVADLEELVARVNGDDDYSANDFSGEYFTLTTDLDLNNEEWTPIGTAVDTEWTTIVKPFSGTFDGAEHTISKLSINSSSSYQGLFGYVDGGTIKNLSVTDSSISVSDAYNVGGIVGYITNNATIDNCDFGGNVSGPCYVGGIAGYANNSVIITNCENSGSISETVGRYGSAATGGIVGYINASTVTSCDNSGTVNGAYDYVGGVVGQVYNNSTISNCTNSGDVNGKNYSSGIAGDFCDSTMTDCTNSGDVNGVDYVGGVVSYANNATISNCVNSGTVTGTSDYAGGIVSYGDTPLTIHYCYNTGDVLCNYYSGGIVGYGNQGTVEYCYNTGNIAASDDYAGGIVGRNSGTAQYCYNTGYIGCTNNYVGGITGSNSGTVELCYNIGDIDYSNDYYGYIVGENTGTVQYCYYDTQMAWYSGAIGSSGDAADDTTNHVEGKTTANMLGDLFGDTTNWTTDSNLYPRLVDPSGSTFDMDTTDVAYVSAVPISFVDGETIVKVTKDFTVCTDNGVAWASEDSDLISITGSNATVLKGDNSTYECGITLTASLNDASRKVYYVNPFSDDAGITSILSESITAGSEAGTSADPITASISVANSVSAVTATDIVGADYATVVFYGTDNTFTTAETESVALTEGDTTTVYIKVTAQDGDTVAYYAVAITRAAAVISNSNFLITKSSPDDSSTATSYYYVYAGNSETSLSSFAGSSADSISKTAYSTVDKAITDINASADDSSMLYFAATGDSINNASGTLDTGNKRITLNSGIYTIKGDIKTTANLAGHGLFNLEGASLIIDGATIESSGHGIRNTGAGSVTVNDGTITASIYAITSVSGDGDVTVNDGTISGTYGAIVSQSTGNVTVNSGTIKSGNSTIYFTYDSTGNLTVNGGSISTSDTSNGQTISFYGSGDLSITGGKMHHPTGIAVSYNGRGNVSISGDVWDDIAKTGTLLSSDASDYSVSALYIENSVVNAKIEGGTVLSAGVGVSSNADITISGGLIKTTGSMPALNYNGGEVRITGGTITSSNENTSLDNSDPNKLPGTILGGFTELYISGGTITNTAATGYAIYNYKSESDSHVYLSGTPTITGNTATVYSNNNIYADDGNGTNYTGLPISIYYGEYIAAGLTVAVSNVSADTNANMFSLKNEGFSLELSGTDLIIKECSSLSSDSSLKTVLGQAIDTEGIGGSVQYPIELFINVANSVSAVLAADIAGAENASVEFYGTDNTFTTTEAGSVSLTAGDTTTVYVKVTAQDGITDGYYAVGITRSEGISSNSNFLITKSSSSDSSTETSYYYVYAGTSETSLSLFAGTSADSESGTAYSTIDLAITDINTSAASSSMLHFAATGNTLENAIGTLDTGTKRIVLTSGTYTIKGALKTTVSQYGNGLLNLDGASVIMDGATIDSADHGIRNNGDGNIIVNSGTITSSIAAIDVVGNGSVTVNGGTISGTSGAIRSVGTGNVEINDGIITSENDVISLSSDGCSGNLTVNGGTISSSGTTDGGAIVFNSSGNLTITAGKMYSLADIAVSYSGTGSLIISGDLWDDTTKTGTLLASGSSEYLTSALLIGSDSTNAEIRGGTLLAASTAVYTKSDVTISGGLIKTTSNNYPALFNENSTVTITGGTITSNNPNTNLDISDTSNIKFPGTIFLANAGTTAKLYISGGTITNTAETGYAIGNICLMSGWDSYVYLSLTPSMTGNTGTVYSYNNIYANDGNGTYYTGSPVSLYYGEDIDAGLTVAVSNVSADTNANLFSLKNEGYSLQLSGTDLIIKEGSSLSDDSSLKTVLGEAIETEGIGGSVQYPIETSISVSNSVSAVSAADIAGADNATVEFYGTDSTFATAETGSVALTAGDTTTVYIKVTAQDEVTVSYYAVEITRAAAISSDSSLSTVLSKEISTEGMGGTALVPINTSISVANSVYAVAATDIAGADNATVEFYGTDSTFTTAEAGSVALTAGDKTTVYIKVTAQDGQTVGYYAVGITRAAAVSSDSSLSTVLSKDISTEGMGGTVEFPITTSISVVNSVSAVEAADITGVTDSTVIFYGTDSTFTTAEIGSVALTAGNKTTVYIKVTAQDEVTVGYYAVTISRATASSSSSSSSHPSSSSQSSSSSGTDVLVNGVAQSAGNEITETVDGKTKTTINVKEDVLFKKITETIANKGIDGTEQNTVEVVVSDTNSDESTVQLNGAIINEMEDNYFDLKLNKGDVSYSIPAKEFTIDAVAEQMGVNEDDLADIEIEITISEPTEEVMQAYEAALATMGDELIISPVSFEIVAHTTNSDGTESTVEINTFSTYVERVFEIPEGVDPSKITTGIVFNQDGTYSHVPTEVFQKDGKWYAKLNSLTNSIYSVVWNPVTVKSVENHWSKDAVNDMASRLVIINPESFEPNKAITRADFAEYIVRALGLYREGSTYENNFKDVSATGERTLAILIANEYGIVSGYEDGTFRGDNQITREEAMSMYQRAMKITKLTGNDVNRISMYSDSAQVSKWAVPCVTDVLSANVFNGTTATTISPKANLTYAEAAQAIKNLLVKSKLINK